jgi:hypothetical protein
MLILPTSTKISSSSSSSSPPQIELTISLNHSNLFQQFPCWSVSRMARRGTGVFLYNTKFFAQAFQDFAIHSTTIDYSVNALPKSILTTIMLGPSCCVPQSAAPRRVTIVLVGGSSDGHSFCDSSPLSPAFQVFRPQKALESIYLPASPIWWAYGSWPLAVDVLSPCWLMESSLREHSGLVSFSYSV